MQLSEKRIQEFKDITEKESGVLNLESIIDYVKKHSEVPKRGRSLSNYGAVYKNILSKVPQTPGWYFWGTLDKNNWRHIYIGKAGHGKSTLHSRIKEELKDERILFWADIWGEKEAIESSQKQYGKKYEWGEIRSLKKKGSKYIIWISDSSATPTEINNEESILIQKLNPSANRDYRGMRNETRKTNIIEKFLKKEIKNIQKTK